jgi:hypothetical protein
MWVRDTMKIRKDRPWNYYFAVLGKNLEECEFTGEPDEKTFAEEASFEVIQLHFIWALNRCSGSWGHSAEFLGFYLV